MARLINHQGGVDQTSSGVGQRISAIVPTAGRSPHLGHCLEALRRDGGDQLEIVLTVVRGALVDPTLLALADTVIDVSPGFAEANNRAFAQVDRELVALVNDDAVVETGWCQALVDALDRRDDAVAVQGVNVVLHDPLVIDGAGIGWNARWQAVQLGHGQATSSTMSGMFEVFGVSATAALYRRSALEQAAAGRGQPAEIFDTSFFAYYEDVDLACALRAAGGRAFVVHAARARHAGSSTGNSLAGRARHLIYGNRHRVLRRWLGKRYWVAAPRLWVDDLVDAARAWRTDPSVARAIVAGLIGSLRKVGARSVGSIGSADQGHLRPADLHRFPSHLENGGIEAMQLEPKDLVTVVVHWRDEAGLARLLDAWDARFPLVVVDNSGSAEPADFAGGSTRLIAGDGNLGFGGGVNFGVANAPESRWILLLNPDAAPAPGALDQLLTACARSTDAGVVPALEYQDGRSQCAWQLQPLLGPWTLVAQTLFIGSRRGPDTEPPAGALIEQPAAAALALRRQVFDAVGGFDADFFPAWFDDVDLARRLARRGARLRFEPAARFCHAMGGSVPALGYGRFLWIYHRNLQRYVAKHHAVPFSLLVRVTLPLALILRFFLLIVRRPRRAASRLSAARGLLAALAGTVSGWRLPGSWAKQWRR